MNTEQELTEYLTEKYKPVAIVLHGSRANGMSRDHSDWDIVMFTNQDTKPLTREIVFGANLELKQIILPVPENKFLGFFFRTENAKILYDPQSIAKKLLELNDSKIKEGNQFTQEDRTMRYGFLSSALDGIGDYRDDPLNLFDKKIDFYTRIVESWFRFKKTEFEPSHYIAFPTIKTEDPELYALIEEFVAKTDADDLGVIGEEILKKLFPDIV
jgi:predicted nucleotidyltransferase